MQRRYRIFITVPSLLLISQCSKEHKLEEPIQAEAAAPTENRELAGFKDVVKNPDYLDQVEEERNEVDRAVEEADDWTDEHLAKIILKYRGSQRR